MTNFTGTACGNDVASKRLAGERIDDRRRDPGKIAASCAGLGTAAKSVFPAVRSQPSYPPNMKNRFSHGRTAAGEAGLRAIAWLCPSSSPTPLSRCDVVVRGARRSFEPAFVTIETTA